MGLAAVLLVIWIWILSRTPPPEVLGVEEVLVPDAGAPARLGVAAQDLRPGVDGPRRHHQHAPVLLTQRRAECTGSCGACKAVNGTSRNLEKAPNMPLLLLLGFKD